MKYALVMAVTMFALCGVARAATDSQLSVEESGFSKQKQQLVRALDDGKTYSEISRADRGQVVDALGRIEQRLSPVADDVSALDDTARVAVFNDQELVNTILTQARADSQLICEQTRRTGSHMRKPRCQTVAERRRRMEGDQEMLRRDTMQHKLPVAR